MAEEIRISRRQRALKVSSAQTTRPLGTTLYIVPASYPYDTVSVGSMLLSSPPFL